MKKHGTFIISLDFELFWGIFDKADITEKTVYFDNTLNTIPKILDLFHQFQIHATWASVGFLFFKDLEELKQNFPSPLPDYYNQKLSAYHYIENDYQESHQKYHFAPEVIQQIKNTPGQEIGTHTLSHYYCLEPGQNADTFEADLQKAVEVAEKFDVSVKSLVFPRNQYQKAYEDILIKNGIKVIRTNPDIWFWDTTKKETLIKKVFRTADAYIPLHRNIFELPEQQDLVLLPAGRFYRPVSRFGILNKLRLNRLKNEMTAAAKQAKVYHLWWHPHNFGNKPGVALSELQEILQHFKYLQKKYHFVSQNMAGIIKKSHE